MKKLHLFSSLSMVCALALSTGCPADDEPADDTGNNNASTGAGDGMDDAATAADDGAEGMMETGMAETGMAETGMAETGMAETAGAEPQPDGAMCSADEDCISMQCYTAGALGGICGECNEDADCEGGGCSIPNPITSAPSVCNDGSLGGGCESADVCVDGLTCALILEVPGILSASTCSECEDDTGCTEADTTCQPTYDVANISGSKTCVPTGSLELGEGCDLTTGAAACMSGICGEADFMSLLQLGICSECEEGSCADGEMCAAPMIDLAMGLVPATCVPMR